MVMMATSKKAFDTGKFLATVGRGRMVTTYGKGALVYQQGGAADSVCYVQSGKIKVIVHSRQGKEAVIAILAANEFFGDGCLIGQPVRLASATAMEKSVIMRVSKTEMVRVLRDEPNFSALFMTHLLSRKSRVEEDLADQLFNSTEKRLARTLLILANFGKDEGLRPITAPISQGTLAEIIGATRPRVSEFMNKFRKLGFISYSGHCNGHLQVHASLVSVVLRNQ